MSDKKITIPGKIFYGIYISRPNKFLVNLIPEGKNKEEPAFLHDPGRLKELLTENAKLLIRKPLTNKERKTKWDILAVEKDGKLYTINSSFPNKIIKKALNLGWISELKMYDIIKVEYNYGDSRLDFLLKDSKSDKKALIEVKGVTLFKENIALFPDAPTKRGTRHIRELIKAKDENYESFIIFVIMNGDVDLFKANSDIDPEFSKTLLEAENSGVNILPYIVIPEFIDQKLCFHFYKRIDHYCILQK